MKISNKTQKIYDQYKQSPIGEIIEEIFSVMEDLNKENLDHLINSYENLQNYMMSLPHKEYSSIDNAIGAEITNLLLEFTKKEEKGKTRYELFIDMAHRNNWLPVINAIDFISKRDKKRGEITDNDISEIEDKIQKTLEYVKNTLSPYYNTIIKNELNKKLRELKNRANRIVNNDVGLYLKQLRKEKGYTLKKLADLAEISQSYALRIEKGERSAPSLPILNKILQALDVNPNDFYRKINLQQNIEEKQSNVKTPENLLHMIYLDNYTIKNQVATIDQKEKLSNLLKEMINVEWSNESKINDMAKILNLFEEFKNTIK